MFNWVTVTDAKVYGYRTLKTETQLYLGAGYPNQLLTVLLLDADSRRLAKSLKGKVISVRGRVMPDNDRVTGGRPTMILNDTAFVKFVK